jgi:hypothetical protein
VFENRVIKKVFGPKRDEVTESWTKLHNEELHTLYSSSGDQIKEDEMGGACSAHGRYEKCVKILVAKPESKRPLERLGHRCEDNIKTDLRVTEFGGVN